MSLILAALTAFSSALPAAYDIPHSVVCSGSGVIGDGTIGYCTAGQLAAGISSNTAYTCKHGFWYPAGISSTVDVAISSFRAEQVDGAVLLYWHAKADAPFEGFHVYRELRDTGMYERINDEKIVPAVECMYRDGDIEPGNTYRYRIGAVQGEDEFFSADLVISIPPQALTLYQNFPNPFKTATSIRCYLPSAGTVTLEIFDVSGRRIRTIMNREKRKGFFVAEWDGRDMRGNPVSSGVYLYRLTSRQKTLSRKLIVLR